MNRIKKLAALTVLVLVTSLGTSPAFGGIVESAGTNTSSTGIVEAPGEDSGSTGIVEAPGIAAMILEYIVSIL